MSIGEKRRSDILNALRKGAVPEAGLDVLAVGLERFEGAIDEELDRVASGGGVFKAIRGEYGTGKTFFVRWLEERAKSRGFATSEVQISETETPLHKLETVYRRAMERLSTGTTPVGAFPDIVDSWFFRLQRDVEARGTFRTDDELEIQIGELLEHRLADITKKNAQFAATLRAYHYLQLKADFANAQALLSWLAGQPNISYSVKKLAGLKGEVDHYAALNFMEGLLRMLRDSGQKGLVLVLDEVETLQRVRSDVRERSLNALRQLVDEVDGGRFPGLYLVITGTPAFYDGPQGIQRLAPLAQRLSTDFGQQARHDNPRAAQIRLLGFTHDSLVEVGLKVRDLYVNGSTAAARVYRSCDDAYVSELASAVAGNFSGEVRVAPRIFLKKLVDVMDKVELFDDFDPRHDYELTVRASELSEEERAVADVDDIELSVH